MRATIPPKRNKYGAQPAFRCMACGGAVLAQHAQAGICPHCAQARELRRFDSRAEARRYDNLRLQVRAGQIEALECQPKFALSVNGVSCGSYIADFRYRDPITGEQVVEAIVPTSDSSTAWTRSTGTTNYETVDEIPPSMTDYVTAASTSLEDIYGMGNTTLTGTANAVSVYTAALQDTVTTGTFRCEVNSSASTTNGATNALATTRKDFVDFFPVDPNAGAAWSNSAVDAATVSIYSVTV